MVTAIGWKNKKGTADRSCACGTWKQHWINNTTKSWPAQCSAEGCSQTATLGGHVINPNETGEWIVPLCASCNGRDDSFDLKGSVTLVPARQMDSCGK